MSRSRDISIILGATEETNTANTALSALDSASVVSLIDSSYVAAREANAGGGGVDSAVVSAIIVADNHHPNISAASSVDNSASDFIQDITLDSNGHITGIVSATSGGGWADEDYVAFGSSMSVAAYASGTHSIAIGDGARTYNRETISIGQNASTRGDYSVCIGVSATSTDYTGQVSIGAFSDTARENSTALGYYAETGNYSNGCTAIGAFSQAMGSRCTAIGQGYSTSFHTQAYTTGQAFGASAYAQLGGTALGFSSSQTGNYANALGSYTNASGTEATAVGHQANANSNYQFVLGNSSVSDLRCQDTSISAVSDRRDKTQIEALEIGLDFVNAIQPVAFYKNNRNTYYVPSRTDEETWEDPSIEVTYTFDQEAYDAGTKKHDKREFGFIAQEVAEQLPAQYSDARLSFNETHHLHDFDVQHFTMGDMTPVLWKALRELSDKHDQLQNNYDALLVRIEALENA